MKTVATMQIKDWRASPGDPLPDIDLRVEPGTWEQVYTDEPAQFYCPLFDAKTGDTSMVLFYVRQVEDDYELRNEHP